MYDSLAYFPKNYRSPSEQNQKYTMVRTYLLSLLCFLAISTSAQKIVEKRLPVNPAVSFDMDLNIADSINIVTWHKNELYAKASIDINHNRNNELYTVQFKEAANKIVIKGEISSNKLKDSCQNITSMNVNWNIYIPSGSEVNIKTINGNISVTGRTGPLSVSTISGYVNMAIPKTRNASFLITTVTGTVYTNLPLMPGDGVQRPHNSIAALYNGGGDRVSLKSVSGDIYLRKSD